MKRSEFKYSGIILMLIGIAIIAVPYFSNMHSNFSLSGGLCLVIVGFVLQIILGKFD